MFISWCWQLVNELLAELEAELGTRSQPQKPTDVSVAIVVIKIKSYRNINTNGEILLFVLLVIMSYSASLLLLW